MNKVTSLCVLAVLFCLTIIPADVNCGVIRKPYEDGSRNISDDIQFHLYTNRNPFRSYILLPGNEDNLADSPFKPERSTVFYIHGFTEGLDAKSCQTIKNAYLENGKFNVIIVDWAKLAALPWYPEAVKNTVVVGSYLGQLLKWLEYKQAISLPDIHIIGFSLGAHVAAFAGEELARNRSEKIGRITGLDPAGPAWDKFSIISNGLDKEDANFVDIIHTNTKTFGIKLRIGHADFYVNYGKSQPGCSLVSVGCSHSRASQYYSESILDPFGFPSSKCESWNPILTNCTKDPDVFMGFAINNKTIGIFFVETKSKTPYAENIISYTKIYSPKSSQKHGHRNRISAEEVLLKENNDKLYPEIVKLHPGSLVVSNFNASNVILKEGEYQYLPQRIQESSKI
ncbi:hypothetical protein PV326_011242 [Microctonus aethiopoides]|nr:hypothetical protein PV326_011242 [Microctonus aethiopoides]